MFFTQRNKPAIQNTSHDILTYLKQPLTESERRIYLRNIISSSAEASNQVAVISGTWMSDVAKLQLDLLKLNESIRLNIIMMKSKLSIDHQLNVDECCELLSHALELYVNKKEPEKCKDLLQKASEIYGGLSIKNICEKIDASILLKNNIEEQHSLAELTLDLTVEILKEPKSVDNQEASSSSCSY